MKRSFCLLDYRGDGITQLDTFGNRVGNGIYTNPAIFPTPPVTQTVFNDKRDRFVSSAADYKTYGLTKKTEFLEKKTEYVETIDTLAVYVDGIALGDVSIITLAGFRPSRAQFVRALPIDKIQGFKAAGTDVSGQVAIEVPPIINRGSVSYSILAVEGAPLTNTTLLNGQISMENVTTAIYLEVNKSRRKLFQNLTPGRQYFFYAYASNSAGVSPLSDVKSVWVS